MRPGIILCISVMMAFSAGAIAQRPITIAEDSIIYSTGKYPGFVLSIPEVSYDRTSRNWVRNLQAGTKSRVVTDNGEMSIFGASIRDVSPNPVNVYSRLTGQDSLVKLYVCIELKKDQYVERATGDASFMVTREYLYNFGKEQYIDFVAEEVRVEDKKLRDLNNDLTSLQNEKSRMQKSIQSNKSLITTEKESIIQQNSDIANLTAEILTQNEQLNTMEEGAAREEKASHIKELEKRKKKLQNGVESSENRINRANSDINDAERNIPGNEEQQEALREKIEQQRAVLQKFTDKLTKVKNY